MRNEAFYDIEKTQQDSNSNQNKTSGNKQQPVKNIDQFHEAGQVNNYENNFRD